MKTWMRDLLLITGGTLIGAGSSYVFIERKNRTKYEDEIRTMKRVLDRVNRIQKERLDAEATLVEVASGSASVSLDDDGNPVITVPPEKDGEVWVSPSPIVTHDEHSENDYHKAINATETPVDLFVSGGVNDYGVSFIEEEDYYKEDGRGKHQITILMDEHNPVFTMEGVPIDDWDERVGDSILLDFYKHSPPGTEPILYVRNHRREEDYEVIMEQP